MLDPTLDAQQQQILREERRLLAELLAQFGRLGAPEADHKALSESLAQLDELFLLLVVGEFNAGKSAFINALLGARVLEEGVTPTTTRIGLLRHAPEPSREVRSGGVEVIGAPVELLRRVAVVDTPGTNAVFREHEALTRDFVPRADLVLFLTSAERPFSESERAFLEGVRRWGKQIVAVVNKRDLLDSHDDVARVVDFVRAQAAALIDLRPEVFAVSARVALRAKLAGDAGGLETSGFPALEAHVARSLEHKQRVRLKLLNPLGVGLHVGAAAEALVAERLRLLGDDFAALESIDAQLALHREDTARDFRFRLADVDQVLGDFEARGHAFFDETLRPGRVFDLLNRARVRDEFETRVVADLPRVVERRVEAIADWMVAGDLKLWQAVMERLGPRQSAHAERIVGQVGGRVDGGFEHDRARLIEGVRREAQRAVEGYDARAEARRLADSVRDAVAGAALLQVGALGLGAAVTALATTTLADVTGIAAAGALSVIGFLLLPARRREARRELRAKVSALRERLMGALTASFDAELERARQRLLEAVGPYTRFVRAEGERYRRERDELVARREALEALRARLG
jgi:GTP-binding protein EngB required for normal cell division